jgi:hypothetical protein
VSTSVLPLLANRLADQQLVSPEAWTLIADSIKQELTLRAQQSDRFDLKRVDVLM